MPTSPFKLFWNLITVCLLLYTATYVPYRVAFNDDDGGTAFQIFDYFVDGLFAFDIFVNFLSALELPNGKFILRSSYFILGGIETRLRMIVASYAKSWFVLDVCGLFPV